jgi:hypothetical protein
MGVPFSLQALFSSFHFSLPKSTKVLTTAPQGGYEEARNSGMAHHRHQSHNAEHSMDKNTINSD